MRSLSLCFSLSLKALTLCVRAFSCLGACSHVGLAGTGPPAGGAGSKGLSFNRKQKLETLAFVLALLRTRLDFFHGKMDGDKTLKTQGPISTQVNLATAQSPMHGSLDCFPCDPMEEPDFHRQLHHFTIVYCYPFSKELSQM